MKRLLTPTISFITFNLVSWSFMLTPKICPVGVLKERSYILSICFLTNLLLARKRTISARNYVMRKRVVKTSYLMMTKKMETLMFRFRAKKYMSEKIPRLNAIKRDLSWKKS